MYSGSRLFSRVARYLTLSFASLAASARQQCLCKVHSSVEDPAHHARCAQSQLEQQAAALLLSILCVAFCCARGGRFLRLIKQAICGLQSY